MTIKKPEIKKPRLKKIPKGIDSDPPTINIDDPHDHPTYKAKTIQQEQQEQLEIPECGLSVRSQPQINDEDLLKSVNFRVKFFNLFLKNAHETTKQQRVDQFSIMNLAENLHLLDLVHEHVVIGRVIHSLVKNQRKFEKAKEIRDTEKNQHKETQDDYCVGLSSFNILLDLYNLLNRAYHDPRIHVFVEFLHILVTEAVAIRGNHTSLVYILKLLEIMTTPSSLVKL